jgi:hypothetical protein
VQLTTEASPAREAIPTLGSAGRGILARSKVSSRKLSRLLATRETPLQSKIKQL